MDAELLFSPVHDPVEEHELEGLLAEVRYEFDMLHFTAAKLLEHEPQWPHMPQTRNVFVESLNIHVRNLVAFFGRKTKPTGSSRDADDVVALHFVSDWDPEKDGGLALRRLTEMSTSLNKRLSHITAYRRRVPKQDDGRLIADVYVDAAVVFERFIRRLPPERRDWLLGHVDVTGGLPAPMVAAIHAAV